MPMDFLGFLGDFWTVLVWFRVSRVSRVSRVNRVSRVSCGDLRKLPCDLRKTADDEDDDWNSEPCAVSSATWK